MKTHATRVSYTKITYVYPYFALPGLIFDTLPVYLAERGHQVDIVSYARSADEKELSVSNKERSMRFHFVDAINISVPRLVATFPFFLSLDRLIERIQPDIIHAHNLPFLTTYQSVRLARRLRIVGIAQVHGLIGQRGFVTDIAQKMFIRSFGVNIFHNAARVVCLTSQDAEDISRSGCPTDKIRIIPNGVDLEKFKPRGKSEGKRIVWCGRFVPQKGLEYLIKALAIVARKHSDVRLIMTGDGPLFSRITSMAKGYGLAENVIFKGCVERSRIPSILNEASIYVLPSLSEGMPFALLEAMASGKAVVASDIPGINNVIDTGSNGILVPPREPTVLANAVQSLIEDPSLAQRLGRNARQLMVEEYSWRKIAERMEKVYCEAADQIA